MKFPAKVKTKMQAVSFRNVEEFLDFLPEEELVIVECLRNLIYNCIPDVTEKLAYNVPYFKRHKNICFIWPASILWGKMKSYSGVRLGFIKGNLLNGEFAYLNKGNRKQIFWKDFVEITHDDIEIVKTFIFEAVILDEQLKNNYGIR